MQRCASSGSLSRTTSAGTLSLESTSCVGCARTPRHNRVGRAAQRGHALLCLFCRPSGTNTIPLVVLTCQQRHQHEAAELAGSPADFQLCRGCSSSTRKASSPSIFCWSSARQHSKPCCVFSGKRLVLTDFTGGINQYRFVLGCILVRDDPGRGLGGAFGITSTESTETVTKFVDARSLFLLLSKCPACDSCSFASFQFFASFAVPAVC